ncbi:carboxymuconolactone decarboxylase family protein [Haloferula sp. BvORR071]|uniref:carboxymuconolactone decarboxylase family protein n=1 Tax=Haloferula sp. BvORR071 TaxID=1396141 RepID=UPI0005581ECD|nr:carboxymuconolactone decarboxylase family protein [Haloferula sp. BvORR071]
MQPRIDYFKADPASVQAMLQIEKHVTSTAIEPRLRELIKLRASQINGCAYCVDMHSRDLRKGGETEQRLNLLCVWKESPLFTDKERAALAWTEAVTLVSQTGVPDAVYEEFSRHFTEAEQVQITLLIGVINSWNRLAISFRAIHPVVAAT